jgi:16S rRNA (cytidine1402-2'-O)-methyltransferase
MAGNGVLYLVSTPIGNLEDLTLRALRILREVPRIACEDTRRTRKLLAHYSISTPVVSFHHFNEARVAAQLIRALLAGQDLALVTDGGTPSVSDPGFSLVRAATAQGIPVVPLPGASALLAALVACGLPTTAFTFLGFLPHRSGERRRFLEPLRDRPETLVFFDSPRRVAGSLAEMAAIFGNRPAAVCREMTKVHEEFLRGTLAELAERLRPGPVRGEVTLVVAGAPSPPSRSADDTTLRAEVDREILETGKSRRDAVRAVARARGLTKRLVYRALRGGGSTSRPTLTGQDESE